MKSKTVTVSFQLRVPKKVRGSDVAELVRKAVETAGTEWLRNNQPLDILDGKIPMRLYRDRVEVFMP